MNHNKRRVPASESEPVNKRLKLDIGEKSLTIYCTPAPLKDLAALKISLAIWRHHNIRFCKNRGYAAMNYDLRNTGESFVYVPPYLSAADYENDKQPVMKVIRDSIETLCLPSRLVNVIENQCKIRERELRLWAFRHKELISLESFNTEDIFWKTDGYIDYLKAVRNVLSSSRLDTLQKFELMSQYCLEDDIESLPEQILNHEVVKKWKWHQKPVQVYWRCYLKHSPNTIVFTPSSSLAMRMLFHHEVITNQSSVDFFYNQLDDDNRMSASIRLLMRVDYGFNAALLSKLNKTEHDRVLMRCAHSVIVDLGRFVEYENYVSNVWINYKEHIGIWEFCQIILSLFQWPKVDEDTQDHVDRLLFDFWDTATDTMRNCLWEKKCVDLLETESRRFEFLKKIFTDASISMRNEIFNNPGFPSFCISLIETHRWHICRTFVELCLPSNDRVFEFQANLMDTAEIKTYCRKLYVEHGVEKLDDLLTIFLPTAVAILEYKKNLVSSRISLRDFSIIELASNRIEKLNQVIDYIFPDQEHAANFRIKLILESKVVKMMCRFINEGNFDKTKSLIDRLLVRTEDVESVKAKLLSEYVNNLKMGKCLHLRNVEWDKFLPWCSDSGKELLKKSLQIDDIFSKMLKRMIFPKDQNYEIKSRLEEIDYFVRWHFETKDKIEEYKVEMAYAYRDMLMKKINTKKLRGLCLRQLIVGWFFNGNQLLIDDFYE